MIRLSILFISSILFASCISTADLQIDDPIIQNVKLFDGDEIFENVTVLTENGIIKNIILNENTKYYGASVIDGTGQTMIPGLINAHVHAFEKEHLKEAARNGVLTLLDLFNKSAMGADSLRSLRDSVGYAYYYSSGPTVTVPGGHATQFGKVPSILEVNNTPQFVADRINEGCDYIKLIIERGSASNPIPTLTNEMLSLAFNTARKENKISVVHASQRSDAVKAVELGANGLAHIWRKDSTEITDAEIAFLKKKDVFIIPTLFVYKKAVKKAGWNIDLELQKKDLLRLHLAGVPILAGTDPPNFGINYGSDLISEIELLVESGLLEIEALKSATSSISRSFKLGQNGFIKQGFSADFVLINGDPTKNISDLSKINGVWKKGQWITPED